MTRHVSAVLPLAILVAIAGTLAVMAFWPRTAEQPVAQAPTAMATAMLPPPSPTAVLVGAPSSPPPERLFAYRIYSPAPAIVLVDAHTGDEWHRYGTGVPLSDVMTRDGKLLWFEPIGHVARNAREGAPYRLVAFDLLTAERETVLEVGRYVSFRFAVSPDGTRVAYSAAVGEPNVNTPPVEIHVFDLGSREDRVVARFGDAPPEVFSGAASPWAWHAAGDGLFIVGAKQSGAAPGRAFIGLRDGSIVYNEHGGNLPASTSRWLVYADINGVGRVYREPQRVRIIDPATNAELNRMEDADLCLWPEEWSPDDTLLLVTQFAPAGADASFPCDTSQIAERWLLSADGTPPRPVADVHTLLEEWAAARGYAVTCAFGELPVFGHCNQRPERHLRVDQRTIAMGDIEALGWIER